jgi:hypothetical protein
VTGQTEGGSQVRDNSLDKILQPNIGDPDKFWIVLRHDRIPRIPQHKDYEEAKKSAETLCQKFPNKYYVLEVVAKVDRGPVEVKPL